MNNKLIQNIQLFLESKGGIKKSWIRSCLILLLSFVISSIILGLITQYGQDGIHFNSSISLCRNLTQNLALSLVAKNIAISAFVIGFFPFLVLFSTWIIGINQSSKSKYFHLFLWFFTFISLLLAIIGLVIFIRASVFNLNTYFV